MIDGNNLLGPYVGKFCMNIAMEKAKQIGIGLVTARRSNHFGIAGYYSLKAVDEELIGLAVRSSFFEHAFFEYISALVYQHQSIGSANSFQSSITGH